MYQSRIHRALYELLQSARISRYRDRRGFRACADCRRAAVATATAWPADRREQKRRLSASVGSCGNSLCGCAVTSSPRAFLLLAGIVSLPHSVLACGQQAPPPSRTSVDTTIVREQQRRIAAFDSVVRGVNTDTLYSLWHAMLSAPDIRKAQLAVMCEDFRITDRFGRAGAQAIDRMNDTLWKRDDPELVNRMDQRLVGESPSIGRDTCGPPVQAAPVWLRDWNVPALPALPPSPDSARASEA